MNWITGIAGAALLSLTTLMPSSASAQSVAASAVPQGATLVELTRWYKAASRDRISYRQGMFFGWENSGFKLEGRLGYLSYTSFPGSRPLYVCNARDKGSVPTGPTTDYFSSLDVNCEGQYKAGENYIIGYVAATQLEGTVPLYRCDTPRYEEDHFDSTGATCEGKPGAVNEGIIGYIWY